MTQDGQDDASASAEARQRGNDFYKNRNFEKAIEAYQKAASLSPKDPAPLSNLSAVSFETGRYADAAKYIRQALELSESESDQEPKKQKLYVRLIKSLLHTNDVEEAAKVLCHIDDKYSAEGLSKDALQTNIVETKDLQAFITDTSRLRSQVFDRLPRYKPYMNDIPEYFGMGHDNIGELFSKKQVKAIAARQDNISAMFCGSGDARHVFSTIMLLGQGLDMGRDKRIKNMHFTLVDIKPAALAKFLIIIDMLIRFMYMRIMKTGNYRDVLVVVAYLYTCQIIPPFVLEKLHEHIDNLVDVLDPDIETDQSEVYDFMHIPTDTRRAVLKVLKQWRQPVGSHYSVARIRPHIRDEVKVKRAQKEAAFGKSKESVSKQDRKDFDSLGCLFADLDFFRRREPEVVLLYEAYKSAEPRTRRELEEYLDAHWSVNVTLLDSDHEATMDEDLAKIASFYASGCEPWSVHSDDSFAHLAEFDPVLTLQLFMPRSKSPVLEGMGLYFDAVTASIAVCFDEISMELILGEMTDVMERVRFHALEHRSCAPKTDGDVDPRTFPKTYDLIHLSNIPDYIGGLLTTFLSARPLLRDHAQASLRFVNLLNPPMFQSHEHFQAEYLLMPDAKQIESHFHLVRKPDPMQSRIGSAAMASMMPMGISPFATEGYFIWEPVPVKPLPFRRLMNRDQLETWIYGHLIKICLPCPRPLHSDRPVFAPLNLTILFRLLEHLAEIGYPAHWLSGIVASICEGRINTRARPPWEIAMSLKDLAEKQPRIDVSVGAWKAEFTTLFATWRRILSFSVIVPQEKIPSLQSIREYTVSFPVWKGERLLVPHFILLFWDTQNARGREPPKNILEMLCFEHMGATEGIETTTLKTGIHIVTTFRFKTGTRTASFWMRDDVVEKMKAGTWKVYIWRTDSWDRLTEGVDVTKDLNAGPSWSDS